MATAAPTVERNAEIRLTLGCTRRWRRTGGPATSGRLERVKPKRVAAALTSTPSTPSEYLKARNRETTMSSAVKALALRRIRFALGYMGSCLRIESECY